MEEVRETTDIFLWANQTDAKKNDLQIELFLFNKNYTPYFMPLKGDVEQQLRPLFLFDYINQVNLGAERKITCYCEQTSPRSAGRKPCFI